MKASDFNTKKEELKALLIQASELAKELQKSENARYMKMFGESNKELLKGENGSQDVYMSLYLQAYEAMTNMNRLETISTQLENEISRTDHIESKLYK